MLFSPVLMRKTESLHYFVPELFLEASITFYLIDLELLLVLCSAFLSKENSSYAVPRWDLFHTEK